MAKRFARASRISVVHPPHLPPQSKLGRRESGPVQNFTAKRANGPDDSDSSHSLLQCRGQDSFWAPGARTMAILSLLVLTLSARAGVREVGTIGLTVDNLDRELEFFTNTLPFELTGISEGSGPEQNQLLSLPEAHLRVAELRLGDEHITLTEHLMNKGRPVPADSQSFDHWFQHIAIVVRDMDQAYDRLRLHKVKQVSTSPQTLPDWNKNAAGIRAFYFRDPEDHVVEIIFFPSRKGDAKWQRPGTNLFLGIDHTAIVVSDTDKSLAFYRDMLGLRVAGESENYGVEQEHLNQVFGARLRITGLRAGHGPGVELLEYITPPGGRALPTDEKANDLLFWNTHLVVDDLPMLSARLRESGALFVSGPGAARSQIVRDPDGHAMQLDAAPAPATASAGSSR